MPDIPRAIREKVRGHINVAVRVLVDRSGAVVGEFIENAGASRYFARQAADAAGKWQFVPVDEVGSRVWLLRFEFTRESATVRVSNTP
jgi:outer membrane biosynthesis protein TonB